ncbi:cation diffusion facilitator family transporter [Luteococcus sanguinis]|uniref:Cation diffusion facilitator family transporter n=1 Tax=Luteococcus sanguinis TaxID=174038 RepID=A0ABW1X0F9_9ACTN
MSQPTPATTAPATEKSSDGSMLTVLVALGANLLIALAKTVAALLTGSASMVAEAAHSWADAGNEGFLMVAERRSNKPADDLHPFGHGREGYIWSMFAALGLFTAGSVVSIYHGITQLGNHEPEADYTIAYIVLAIAFVLEGASFLQARRQASRAATKLGASTLRYVADTSNPTLRAVFFEDAAALVGLVVAFAGILTHQLTGDAIYDAIGSIVVGILLGVIALFLIGRNSDFLAGQSVSPAFRARALAKLLEHPEISRVTYLFCEYVGADKVFLVAAVDLAGDAPESHVAEVLRRLEAEITDNDLVERAVLTLSAPSDAALTPDASSLNSR